MCGIAGFVNISDVQTLDALGEIVTRMGNRLRHRGPDGAGVWVDATSQIGFSHRRLSIIDLSEHGAQPMVSASGRFVISFNGEIYNYRELRRRLSGYPYRGGSDTEVILAALEAHGFEATLPLLNGMFAFAVFDTERRIIHFALDRFGEKPLYYGISGGALLFGSELSALKAHPQFAAEIDRDVIPLFLQFSYVPKPRSIYKGIRKLPAGTSLSIPLQTLPVIGEPVSYWSAREAALEGLAKPFCGTAEDAVTSLDTLLTECVKMRMEADVPLGAFLSGGVDSSAVVALMQKNSTRRVRTFTLGFHEKWYNEADDASAIARHLGTDHSELYVTAEDCLSAIPRMASIYSEPFGDSSQIPTFLVSQLARRDVTVSLSGDGGDEIFGGYNRYTWAGKIWTHLGSIPMGFRTIARGTAQLLSPVGWDAVMKLAPARYRVSAPGNKIHKLAAVLDSDSGREVYRRLVSQWHDPWSLVPGTFSVDDRTDEWSRFSSFVDGMMYMDTVTYLPDDILVKLDRASMAVSLESRAPLLDHRIYEFMWSIPQNVKFRDGRSKWLLREVLDRYVPGHLLDRPKSGFGVPIDVWLRGPLREWAEELLSVRRLNADGYLNSAPIRRKWTQHLSGKHNWSGPLWNVLMFQSWLEHQTVES